jgi:hypothetical protein
VQINIKKNENFEKKRYLGTPESRNPEGWKVERGRAQTHPKSQKKSQHIVKQCNSQSYVRIEFVPGRAVFLCEVCVGMVKNSARNEANNRPRVERGQRCTNLPMCEPKKKEKK